ncbi:MAG: hypothetical protein ACYDC3_19215 [Candidatus Binataceae bacterium]
MRTQPSGLDGLVAEIVSSSRPSGGSVRETAEHVGSLLRCEYGSALRKHFDDRDIQSLTHQLTRSLPSLNRRVFADTDLRRLSMIATQFGVTMRTEYLPSVSGRTLRGFYVNDTAVLKAPLICLNMANHPVGVAAAFWHEMGHHLTHDLFGPERTRIALSFTTNYQAHLDQPEEIAADLVMVMGCYPRRAAEGLFKATAGGKRATEQLPARVRDYVRSVTGFDFSRAESAVKNLYTLGGMIHVAKLRLALLQEYAI